MKTIENIQTDTYSSSPMPDGMVYLPDARTRREVLVDLRDLPTELQERLKAPQGPAPAPPVPAMQVVHVPARPRGVDAVTTRILAAGASGSAILVAAGEYAPQLGQFGHTVQMVGIGAGVLAGGVALLKGSAPKVIVNLTNTITGASASSSSDASASSAAGWKNQAGSKR